MKNKIFLYLFIFSSLFVLFQFKSAINAKQVYEGKIHNLNKLLKAKDSINQYRLDSLVDVNLDSNYFSLDSDEEAIAYLESQGHQVKQLEQKITDSIIDMNKAGKDNPLVPFVGMEGNMAINKVRLLNHKWILADFTDGVYWGQLFISYAISKTGEPQFEVEKSFLYPRN